MKKTCVLLAAIMFLAFYGCKKESKTLPINIKVMTEGETLSWNDIEIPGVDIDVLVVPEGKMAECVTIEKPNIVYLKSKNDMEALSDKLLNIKEINVSEYERAKMIFENAAEAEKRHVSSDGKFYVLPELGVSEKGSTRAWLYRADVFAEAGIAPPNTMNELYNAALILKRKFKYSTPLAIRDGYYGLDLLAPAWSTDASIGVYYDFEKEKWKFGLCEPWAGNFVSYWSIMAKNELVPSDYLTMTNDEVDELIEQNRVFIIPDYIWRIEQYNEKYKGQEWRICQAPSANFEGAQNKIARREMAFSGYAILDRDDREDTAAISVLNEVYKRICDSQPSEDDNNLRLAQIYVEEEINPTRYLSIADVENVQVKIIREYEGEVRKFLSGEIPMTEWGKFADGLQKSGVKNIINEYKRAYNRIN